MWMTGKGIFPKKAFLQSQTEALESFLRMLRQPHGLVHVDDGFAGGWAFGADPWRKLRGWLIAPRDADVSSTAAYAFGLLFTLFLASMRTRFLWWPFHPVGYLVSGSFGLFRLWLPIFLTWLIKTLILRYGGLDWYRKARPFFFGLIVGDCVIGSIWTLIAIVFEIPAYSVWM